MEMDWKQFKEFCGLRSKNQAHINNLVSYSKKYGFLLELKPLDFGLKLKEITAGKKTLKRHILQALAALSKYLDLKKGGGWYERFKELRAKAGISWTEEKVPQILGTQLSKEKIFEIVKNLDGRLRATSLLHLITGLRTTELFYLIKNWESLKKVEFGKGWAIELGYLKKTKKAFLTFLHRDAFKLLQEAYRSKRSYWRALKKFGIKPYDFRRIFESVYDNLRSHEVDLLQGRLATELTIHYTRDLESICKRMLEVQESLLRELRTIDKTKEILTTNSNPIKKHVNEEV